MVWFFKILFIFREGKRGRNINVWLPLVHPLLGIWPATQAWSLTGNPTGNPLVRRPALNPLSASRISQGWFMIFKKYLKVSVDFFGNHAGLNISTSLCLFLYHHCNHSKRFFFTIIKIEEFPGIIPWEIETNFFVDF